MFMVLAPNELETPKAPSPGREDQCQEGFQIHRLKTTNSYEIKDKEANLNKLFNDIVDNLPLLEIIVIEIDSGRHPPAAKKVIPNTASGIFNTLPKNV